MIEQRIEAARRDPDYQTWSFPRDRDLHRSSVGGLWEEMGQLQLDFLKAQGLTPQMRFLDVGCGSLRAGRMLVDYLEPGNYYGIDIGADIIEVGYTVELTDAQRERLPLANLRATDRFDSDFGVGFDMAIAQSVFTHISLNHVRLCLYRTAKVMVEGGRFFATFKERGRDVPVDATNGREFSERNVYWNYRQDMRWAAERTPFDFRYIGGWDHPRDQRMVEYTRRGEPPAGD